MKVCSFALKGAVLLSFLTAPVYANPSIEELQYHNWIRSKTIKEIAEDLLETQHDFIVHMCRKGKRWNMELKYSIFGDLLSNERLTDISKKTNSPYDVTKKKTEGITYAMYFICPEVW